MTTSPFLFTGLLMTLSASIAYGAEWSLASQSEDKHLTGELSCDQPPASGIFVSCSVSLMRAGEPVNAQQVLVSGGMPAHGHGLPTAPVTSPTEAPGWYSVKGLKFSMPGDWVLGFELPRQEANQKAERLLFEFTLEK